MKIVGRGDTTVVDAYLSPILRQYVDRVAAETGDVRLMFMQSNGGLVDARLFQGKDAIVRPAGGIVGAAKTAALAGLEKIVGFDMGGTLDRRHPLCRRLRARLRHRGRRGAHPGADDEDPHGPRAAGRSSASTASASGSAPRVPAPIPARPATAVAAPGRHRRQPDGRQAPARLLPPRLGPSADRPLDAEVVRAAFAALAHEVARSTGIDRSPEELAHGCSPSPTTTWPTRSRRSRSSAAST